MPIGGLALEVRIWWAVGSGLARDNFLVHGRSMSTKVASLTYRTVIAFNLISALPTWRQGIMSISLQLLCCLNKSVKPNMQPHHIITSSG